MRPLLVLLSVCAVGSAVLPAADAFAQQTRRDREEAQKRKAEKEKEAKAKASKQDEHGPVEVARRHAAGPCPYVKVLYDAARYVEFEGGKEASGTVAYTGEIEGVNSDCEYKAGEPIQVKADIGFALGRGPQGASPNKTYRYWVAVTERNKSVLAKQYFDLPVQFPANADRMMVNDTVENIVIPRANDTVQGSSFEVLIGFDVNEQQAAFNREGKRFRINAGSQTAQSGTAGKQ
jgi:hypothetical protein